MKGPRSGRGPHRAVCLIFTAWSQVNLFHPYVDLRTRIVEEAFHTTLEVRDAAVSVLNRRNLDNDQLDVAKFLKGHGPLERLVMPH